MSKWLLLAVLGALSAAAMWTYTVSAQSSSGIPFNCFVAVSTSTALTAVGGACSARGNGDALYLTDIAASANVGSITADTHNTIKYGTGTACGTGTVTVWAALTTTGGTLANVTEQLHSPIRIPPGRDICWINSTVGSKTLTLSGYEAP